MPMEAVPEVAIIAGVTLVFNIGMHLFGGGWKVSGRLSSIETGMASMQSTMQSMQGDFREFGNVLVKLADMKGDMKVFETRLTELGKDVRARLTAAEQDIRELRHGEGFVRGGRGLDKEYP